MNKSNQLENKTEQLMLLSKADARALAKKIKASVIAAHDHMEQAGRWLMEFRDGEGWASLGYDSWSACVAKEFSTTHGGRAQIFRLIQNAEVTENLAESGENGSVSASESAKVSLGSETPSRVPISQTQHLAKLPAHRQRPAFQRAVALGHGKPTEATVRMAVDEALRAARPVKETHRDKTGYAIPEEIMDLWNRRDEVKEILSAISKTRCAVRAAIEKDDPLFYPSNVNGALANLNSAYGSMEVSMPYAVCPTCQGRARDTCASCKGRGLVSKLHFDTCVPEELKAIRAKSCVAP
jgi:hypothetical protein